jgi:hypothetical protein
MQNNNNNNIKNSNINKNKMKNDGDSVNNDNQITRYKKFNRRYESNMRNRNYNNNITRYRLNRFNKVNNNNQNVIKVNKPKNVVQKNFNRNGKNSVINGKDLIIATNNNLVVQQSGLYAIIPINPLYWQGTRLKNMALQYQYFTPKQLSIEYVPTVSKFQAGNITIGCISKSIVNQSTIQQTLVSSTSGETFSCSEYFIKNIALNSLLQQKKLLLSSSITKESVPFYIVIYLSGVLDQDKLIAPGSFYFNYSVEFFNPITETLYYKTDNSIKLIDADTKYQNITALLMEPNGKYGIGTKIDIDAMYGDPIYKYNGAIIDLDTQKYATILYSTSPESLQTSFQFDLSEFNYTAISVPITLLQNQHLMIINTQAKDFTDYLRLTSGSITVTSNRYYKVISDSPGLIESLQHIPFVLNQLGTSDTSVFLRGTFHETEFINEQN